MKVHLIDEEDHSLIEKIPINQYWNNVENFLKEFKTFSWDNCLCLIHVSDDFWKIEYKNIDNLKYTINSLCKYNCRIILFSGGNPRYSIKSLRHSEFKKIEKKYWLFLSVRELLDRIDWNLLVASNITENLNISAFLKDANINSFQLEQEIEKKRSVLHHDYLKNIFIAYMESSENRNDDIEIFWAIKRGDKINISKQDYNLIVEKVQEGIIYWPNLFIQIDSFIKDISEKYGFRWTIKGELFRKRVFEGKNSLIAKINKFIENFDKIAMTPYHDRISKLNEFWNIIDMLTQELSEKQFRIREYFDK